MNNQSEETITLDSLSNLTGFPAELIRKELFDGTQMEDNQEIPLADLRKAMLSFIDETMLEDKKELH
ncbi:MAG: hypothetical protein N4A33_05590 [Bacteriovoracaceae bacterium]|jgi:hypothetical protein|nr:hypothetical protein [Bacteriovoracaceae bacterium]